MKMLAGVIARRPLGRRSVRWASLRVRRRRAKQSQSTEIATASFAGLAKTISSLLQLLLGRCLAMTTLLLFIFTPLVFSEDDFQYWSQYSLKAIDTKYVDYVSSGELRLIDDVSDFSFWRTTQRLIFDLFPYLSLGTNYTFLEEQVINSKTKEEEFKYHHRLELEVSPQYEIKKWVHVNIKNRNRFEFRWIEDQGSDNGRFRQRWELEFPVSKVPRVKSVYINNEFFVAMNRQELNQNRVIPFGINFKVCSKASLSVFYMIQSKKGAHDWSSNQIVGTHLSISL